MAQAVKTSTVLIVDDESPMRELIRRYLMDLDFQLLEAGSGEEALAVATDPDKLDLLITDEVMPGIEGHELSRRLRSANPNLKVLYLTGFADHLFDAKQQMWDLEAYLDKPFTAQSLREAVALLMTGRLKF
jgi:two-component system, cell cycle sensor histidine kinase and response regulator CckA